MKLFCVVFNAEKGLLWGVYHISSKKNLMKFIYFAWSVSYSVFCSSPFLSSSFCSVWKIDRPKLVYIFLGTFYKYTTRNVYITRKEEGRKNNLVMTNFHLPYPKQTQLVYIFLSLFYNYPARNIYR